MGARGPGFALCILTQATDAELACLERALEQPDAARVAVMLRDKTAAPDVLRARGEGLAALTQRRGCGLRVHASAGIALARQLGAEGVHFASDPGAPSAWVGRELRLGVSCHDRAQLASAAALGADYAFLSPFASTPGKGPALGPEGFATLARSAPLPVVALGGIGAGNALVALRAGASALACIRSVLDAEDPRSIVRTMLDAAHEASAPDLPSA